VEIPDAYSGPISKRDNYTFDHSIIKGRLLCKIDDRIRVLASHGVKGDIPCFASAPIASLLFDEPQSVKEIFVVAEEYNYSNTGGMTELDMRLS
jgi:hypothetical protein